MTYPERLAWATWEMSLSPLTADLMHILLVTIISSAVSVTVVWLYLDRRLKYPEESALEFWRNELCGRPEVD